MPKSVHMAQITQSVCLPKQDLVPTPGKLHGGSIRPGPSGRQKPVNRRTVLRQGPLPDEGEVWKGPALKMKCVRVPPVELPELLGKPSDF